MLDDPECSETCLANFSFLLGMIGIRLSRSTEQRLKLPPEGGVSRHEL